MSLVPGCPLSTDLSAFTPPERISWLETYIKSMQDEFKFFGEMPCDTAKVNWAKAQLAADKKVLEQ